MPEYNSALLPGINFENISTPAVKSLCMNNDMHRLRRKCSRLFNNNYGDYEQRDEGAIDAVVSSLLVILGFDSEPVDLRYVGVCK